MRANSTFVAGLALGLCVSTITGVGWSRSQAGIRRATEVQSKEATKSSAAKGEAPKKAEPASKNRVILKQADSKNEEFPEFRLRGGPESPNAAASERGHSVHHKSEKILAIEKALQKPVTFDFAETPLTDVIEFLRDYTKVNIVLDRNGLATAQVEPDTPVTLSLQEVTLRSSLRLMLDPLELTYIVGDDVLTITDKQETGAKLETRVYPVADLVVVRGLDRGEIMADEFIELIQNTLHADTWTENGGTGAVEFSLPAFSLVVTQTQLVHAEVEALLGNLRAAREKLGSHLSPEMGDLSTLHELYLTQGDKDRAEQNELAKLRAAADTVEHQKAEADLRRVKAEAEFAELKLKNAKDKAEGKQKKATGKAKDSNS